MPFYKVDSNDPPPQITLGLRKEPTKFDLLTSFRYVDGLDEEKPEVVVQPRCTDLASVPFFLQWLVRSYGRHTRAALVHDELWASAGADADKLRRANTLFRHAMWELGVPWLRRWLMWVAVTLGMFARTKSGVPRLVVWVLATAVAVAALLARGEWIMHWEVGKAVLIVATVLVVGALVAFVVGGLGSLAAEGANKPYWSSMAKGGLSVAGTLVALTGLVLAAGTLAAVVPFLKDEPWVDGVLIGLALAVWGRSMGAGAIATVTVLLLAVPLAGIGAALYLYSALELLALLLLLAFRGVKKAVGHKPKGPANPMLKGPIA